MCKVTKYRLVIVGWNKKKQIAQFVYKKLSVHDVLKKKLF